jgi:hypothetical protein
MNSHGLHGSVMVCWGRVILGGGPGLQKIGRPVILEVVLPHLKGTSVPWCGQAADW